MDRKAQGLSLNTIIVAIVVLIVLVVLIMIFTGYFGTRFTPEVTSCANSGGDCEYVRDNCGVDSFDEPIKSLRASCPAETEGGNKGLCCTKAIGRFYPADAIVVDDTCDIVAGNCGIGDKPCDTASIAECSNILTACDSGKPVENGVCPP